MSMQANANYCIYHLESAELAYPSLGPNEEYSHCI